MIQKAKRSRRAGVINTGTYETVEVRIHTEQMREVEELAERSGESVALLLDVGLARTLSWLKRDYVPAIERRRREMQEKRRAS